MHTEHKGHMCVVHISHISFPLPLFPDFQLWMACWPNCVSTNPLDSHSHFARPTSGGLISRISTKRTTAEASGLMRTTISILNAGKRPVKARGPRRRGESELSAVPNHAMMSLLRTTPPHGYAFRGFAVPVDSQRHTHVYAHDG